MSNKEEKKNIVVKFGLSETDTGRDAVQVALLTTRIIGLTEHLKTNKKDYSTKRGLLKLVGRRKRLLSYIERRDVKRYRELIAELNLRK
ncbi:MAG: 30S ribosomal protein S15 [Cyanobacteria bacterium REEB446]|jgi:small subunit ribosomal protein S15|nr:30S ribosomal protein S15 [Cyanobacteria bacterium REEB446]